MKINFNYKQWTPLFKMLTLGDRTLVIFLIAISVFSFFALNRLKKPGSVVIVEIDGREFARLDLNTSQQITLKGPIGKTILEISNGSAGVIDSDCPQKICVKTGKIYRAGDVIVCVPNRIVIRINGETKNSFDVITQ